VSDTLGHTHRIPVTVTGGAPTPTPTPVNAPTNAPTQTPTAPPPGVFSVNPATVNVIGTGAANEQTILVQETGDVSAFSQTSASCAGIATITPASSAGPTVSFTVVGVAAGTCSATFSDTHGQSALVSIIVTTSGFTVQSKQGHL
jgi:hypothetical protein